MKIFKFTKKQARILVFVMMLSLLFTTTSFAHELWLELDSDGEVGKEHTVDVIWGHFPEVVDPESSYFNEVIDGELWLLTPTGERIDLELTKLEDRYQAKFTPEMGGDYQVVFRHDRGVLNWEHGEPAGMQSIVTLSKAYIDVHAAEETPAWEQLAGLTFEIKAITDVGHLHANEEMESQLLYQGQPLPGAAITVVAPDEEVLQVTTDNQGIFKFTPTEEGAWLIKAAYFDENVSSVAGEEVLGARYSLTMLVQPHAHDDEEIVEGVTTDTDTSSSTYIYALAAALFAGAGYLVFNKK